MKKIFLTLSLLFAISVSSYSQIYVDNQGNVKKQRKSTASSNRQAVKNESRSSGSSFDMSKLSVGGNFSLQFGDYTVIGILQPGLDWAIHTIKINFMVVNGIAAILVSMYSDVFILSNILYLVYNLK